MKAAHHHHCRDRTEFPRERRAERRGPETRRSQDVRPKHPPELEVERAGHDQHGDRPPADGPESLAEPGKELGAQRGRLDGAQHGSAHGSQEEHAAQPQECREDVNGDVRIVPAPTHQNFSPFASRNWLPTGRMRDHMVQK